MTIKPRKGPTPDEYAAQGSEHAQQVALFMWAALPEQQNLYPDLRYMFAVPNGGERNKIVASKLKAEGVKRGVLDVWLPLRRGNFVGLVIEMKVKPSGHVTDEQSDYLTLLASQGWATFVAWTYEEARTTVKRYMDLPT